MAWHHHRSDMPTSPSAVLHHTDAILCTILHRTVCNAIATLDFQGSFNNYVDKKMR